MKIQDFINSLEKEIDQAVQNHEKDEQLRRLKEIAKVYEGEDRLISSHEIVERLKNNPRPPSIKIGFSRLDAITGGFRPSQLIVISAPTKAGKTSWLLEFTYRLKDYKPVWLPFEEKSEELLQRFIDWNVEPPEFLTPAKTTPNKLEWIEERIIEAKARFDSSIIFIDHLHFVVPFASTEKRFDLMVGQTMRELKRMARDWGVVIFLIAHIKKTKIDIAPDLESLRDSSFIAQEADKVIMLWRKTERVNGKIEISNTTNVSVQANRQSEGGTGNVSFVFNKGRFLEMDQHQEKEIEDDF